MSFATMKNIGAFIKAVRAAANTAVTAGGAGDNAAVTGVTIDRLALNLPMSAVFAIAWTATLAAAATLTFKNVVIEHGAASNMSDAATFATLEDGTGTVIQAGGAGGTFADCKEYDVDLQGAKQYVRIKFTPDLSAANTDTAALAAVAVFGGSQVLPA
jgi:hypothetical protein